MTDQQPAAEKPDDVVWIETHVEMSSVAGSGQQDYTPIPRAEWDALNDKQREQLVEELADGHLANAVSAGGRVVDASKVPAGYGR